jgi:F-type H+-transporting ATPase subunit alpha
VPLGVSQQVISIYAAINGYLDDYPTTEVGRYEQEMLKFVKEKHKSTMDLVDEKKVLDDEVEGAVKKALDAFKQVFSV